MAVEEDPKKLYVAIRLELDSDSPVLTFNYKPEPTICEYVHVDMSC